MMLFAYFLDFICLIFGFYLDTYFLDFICLFSGFYYFPGFACRAPSGYPIDFDISIMTKF